MSTFTYINIESVPPVGSAPDPDSVVAPATHKKPEAIRKYQLEHAVRVHADLAKDPRTAQVFIVTILGQDDPEPTMKVDFNERSLIEWLGRWLEEHSVQCWMTFNGSTYDYPALFWRGAKYGVTRVREEFRFRGSKYSDPRLLDLCHQLDGGKHRYVSLDKWVEFFCIDQDNPIRGGDIPACIQRGQHDLVLRHARSRVTSLRAIHQRFL